MLHGIKGRGYALYGEQNGGGDGNGTVGHVLMDPLDASHSQLQMEVVCECVFKTKEYV